MDKNRFQEFLQLDPAGKSTMRVSIFEKLTEGLAEDEKNNLERDLVTILEMQGAPGHEEHTGRTRDRLTKMCEKKGVQFDELLLSLELCRTDGGTISQLSLNITPIRDEIKRVFARPSVDQ